MTGNRMSTAELVKAFEQELRQLPLDFPVGRWGEKAIKAGSELFYAFGRKGTHKAYGKEIAKTMAKHPQGTVHTDYAVDWVAGKILDNACFFDNFCRD